MMSYVQLWHEYDLTRSIPQSRPVPPRITQRHVDRLAASESQILIAVTHEKQYRERLPNTSIFSICPYVCLAFTSIYLDTLLDGSNISDKLSYDRVQC